MRIAIVSDIHGNRTAFEAVLVDLRQTAPDLILHGGDLADGGASPVEIVDRIRSGAKAVACEDGVAGQGRHSLASSAVE
jgi:predicted phosphodiesterase